jgi:Mor family transcriptional regulator
MEEFAEKRGVRALLDVAQVVTEALTEDGIEAVRAREIGLAAAEKLRFTYGGDQMYIPNGLSLQLGKRDLEIYADFDGSNHFVLAKKYELTVRQIYSIVDKVRREDFGKRQLGLLFDAPDGEEPEGP